MMVTLACLGSTSNVARTIAHELGHNLDLLHGGDTVCNGKPNYNSVMNYRFQFTGIDTDCNGSGDAITDSSIGARPELDENGLVEAAGTCGEIAKDWNVSGSIEVNPVVADINDFGAGQIYENNQPTSCGGVLTVLQDFYDWAASNLALVSSTGAGGAQVTVASEECASLSVLEAE
jgi:hypothetical protein